MLKNCSKGKKEKDKSVHEAVTDLERGDSGNLLSRFRLNLHDFLANYISNCSIRSKLSNYQVYFQVLL